MEEEWRREKERNREKKMKKEEKLRMEENARKERMRVKKMMKERWEMIRWVTGYLSRNQERWEVEKRERDQERRRRLDEWDKEEGFRKISMLREKLGRRGEREKRKYGESIRDG